MIFFIQITNNCDLMFQKANTAILKTIHLFNDGF